MGEVSLSIHMSIKVLKKRDLSLRKMRKCQFTPGRHRSFTNQRSSIKENWVHWFWLWASIQLFNRVRSPWKRQLDQFLNGHISLSFIRTYDSVTSLAASATSDPEVSRAENNFAVTAPSLGSCWRRNLPVKAPYLSYSPKKRNRFSSTTRPVQPIGVTNSYHLTGIQTRDSAFDHRESNLFPARSF